MSSEAQISANRLNAQKSTGPRTTEGKAVVSQNALTHGLSSQQDIISNEDPAEYNLHRSELLAELNPLGPMESMLADRIVSLSWRLKRAVSIQNQAISVLLNPPPPHPLSKLADSLVFKMNGLPEPESTPPDPSLALGRAFVKDFSNSKVLDRLLMYERRIEHSLFKTITELQRLTLIRKMNPPDKPSHNSLCHSESAASEQICLAPKPASGSFSLPRLSRAESRGSSIMQNEANFGKVNLPPTPSPEMTYAKNTLSANLKNEPKSDPISSAACPEGVQTPAGPLGMARPWVS